MSFLWPSLDDRQRELLERSRKGDRDAFRALYLELYGPVATFVGRRVGCREDAEDLVSRVFHKLLERLGDFDAARGSARMFVLSIARNAVIDHVRTAHRGVPVDDFAGILADETGTPLDALVREEELREVRAVLLELPEEVREMISLHYGDGLRHGEIAEILGLRVDAVKQRFSRALRALKERLRERRSQGPEGASQRSSEGESGVINVRF
jgi:RNA polymerase sigma-70 factor (ECF subfamily)